MKANREELSNGTAGRSSFQTFDARSNEASTNDCKQAPRQRGPVKLLLFFAFIAALAFVLDATISYGLRHIRTSKFGSLNNVMSGTVNAEIVINGSSRALVHYDPRVIQNITGKTAYNLGMNGIQIDVQLAILKAYLSRNTRPQLVIQNLESYSFESTRKGEIYDPALYVPYIADKTLYRDFLEIDRGVWKWRHIPLYGYAVEDMKFTWVRGLLGWIGRSGPEDYFLGFNPREMPWTEDFERFKSNVGAGITYRIEPRGVSALREIIALCKNEGIKLILVYSPEYFEMQALERNRAQVFDVFHQLSAEFKIPFWDYSDSPICRQRDYFYNSQHLNATGASVFTLDVAHRLAKSRLGLAAAVSPH
jgi:hypothetical protein